MYYLNTKIVLIFVYMYIYIIILPYLEHKHKVDKYNAYCTAYLTRSSYTAEIDQVLDVVHSWPIHGRGKTQPLGSLTLKVYKLWL